MSLELWTSPEFGWMPYQLHLQDAHLLLCSFLGLPLVHHYCAMQQGKLSRIEFPLIPPDVARRAAISDIAAEKPKK